jgi:hypothetical protein
MYCGSSLEGADAVKLLLSLAAVATLSGCRFWYKPVPVANAIGEEKTVLAGDSVHVFREARFEVYGPSPEAVYDGYEQLNRASRTFERHFDAPAARLAVVLEKDSVRPYDVGTLKSFHDRGFTLVRYVRPRSYRDPTRYGAMGYGGVLWPIAPTAARLMLARYAADQMQLDGAASDSAALERLPVWFRAATIHLIGEGGFPTNDLEFVRDKRGSLLPLRDVLTLVRPPAADSLLDPSRRAETDDVTRLAAAEASTFARYVVEREGPTVLARIARDYLRGRSLTEIIASFQSAPHAIADLEQRWRMWVLTREN